MRGDQCTWFFHSFLEWNPHQSDAVRSHAISTELNVSASSCKHTYTPEMVITAWYTLLCDSGDNNFSLLWSSARRKAVLWEANSSVYFVFVLLVCLPQSAAKYKLFVQNLSLFGLFCDVLLCTLVHRTLAVFFLFNLFASFFLFIFIHANAERT